jgi:ribonucleotide monophosphatase NagD (HAD superfamily)
VATNADAADSISGRLMPGAGAIVAAIQNATGQPPVAVAGKPSPWLMQVRKQHLKNPSTTHKRHLNDI